MGQVFGVGLGIVVGLVVVARGARLIVRGRREGRELADPEDRMVASFRVVAGVRMVNKGLLLLVLVAVAALLWPSD